LAHTSLHTFSVGVVVVSGVIGVVVVGVCVMVVVVGTGVVVVVVTSVVVGVGTGVVVVDAPSQHVSSSQVGLLQGLQASPGAQTSQTRWPSQGTYSPSPAPLQ